MAPTITLQVSERVIALLERLADQITSGRGYVPIAIQSGLALVAALLAAGLTALWQWKSTRALFEHQRRIEQDKQRHQERMTRYLKEREHYQLAYEQILALEDWAGDEVLAIARNPRTKTAWDYAGFPRAVRVLRMHLDLIEAKEVLIEFTEMDDKLRVFKDALRLSVIACETIDMVPPNFIDKIGDGQTELLVALDRLKVMIRERLGPMVNN